MTMIVGFGVIPPFRTRCQNPQRHQRRPKALLLQESHIAGHFPQHYAIDVVFPMVHGLTGEDGSLQGLLEISNLPYVGAGILPCALSWDKYHAKCLVAQQDIPVVPYQVLFAHQWQNNLSACMGRILQQLSYPLFVKPSCSGSSIGIERVTSDAALLTAIKMAFFYDDKVLIETALDAREIECSVLEHEQYGQAHRVSVPGEITTRHAFYNYDAKYIDVNSTQLLVPAQLGAETIQQIQRYAQDIFHILSFESMARMDFLLDRETATIYFNEANAIPGFTQVSMYPKLWAASGLSYVDLINHLIELALTRHARKQRLIQAQQTYFESNLKGKQHSQ